MSRFDLCCGHECSLLSPVVVFSLTAQISIQCMFQVIALKMAQAQSWYQQPVLELGTGEFAAFEGTGNTVRMSSITCHTVIAAYRICLHKLSHSFLLECLYNVASAWPCGRPPVGDYSGDHVSVSCAVSCIQQIRAVPSLVDI
jgi:hypothetical protein